MCSRDLMRDDSLGSYHATNKVDKTSMGWEALSVITSLATGTEAKRLVLLHDIGGISWLRLPTHAAPGAVWNMDALGKRIDRRGPTDRSEVVIQLGEIPKRGSMIKESW